MNKYDWLELATRVLGVWLVVNGALGVLNAIGMQASVAAMGRHVNGLSSVSNGAVGSAFLVALGTSFLGTVMVLLAPGFVGWLKNKDARALASNPPTAASPASEPR